MYPTERNLIELFNLGERIVTRKPLIWSAVPRPGDHIEWSSDTIKENDPQGLRRRYRGKVIGVCWCEGTQYSKFMSAKIRLDLDNIHTLQAEAKS